LKTRVPTSLVEAFHKTSYTVHAPDGDFTLRIGEHSAALQKLMQSEEIHCCALLTAYNPGAQPVDSQANAANQRQLEQAVDALEVPHYRGKNVPADRTGPIEQSVLLLGIDRQRAYQLALQLRQLAFVYADARAVPELVWVDLNAGNRTGI
jgi:hypothetical protein